MSKKLLRALEKTRPDTPDYLFWCPGCKHGHALWTTGNNRANAIWTFNGNEEHPTFNPSLLNHYPREGEADHVCHLFVTDGNLVFLGDCTHELAGRTIPMVEF